MSLIAMRCESRYAYTDEERISVADVLQKLKEDLAAQEAVLADAKRAVQQLQVAIAAIERDEVESKKRIEHQRPTARRGQLSRAVAEAIQDGIGGPSAIVSHLERQGITTTQPSVSNAIQRLQDKKQIHFDQKLRKWVSTTNTGSLEGHGANKVSASDRSSEAERNELWNMSRAATASC